MGSNTKVEADLVVNDQTAATFGRIKGGLESINKRVDKVTHGMKKFISSTASTALGFQLATLGDTIGNVYHASIDAAMAANKEEKAIAAAMMLTDQKNRSYADMRVEATGIRKELRQMGMEAGISGESVVDSFNDIAARTNKSTDEVKVLMGQMVLAGRIVPGGLASITQGFEQIELGMMRGTNPIVQMIAATGLLKGNARDVAKQMQKMTPDKMMEISEKAIVRMANKMKGVPLSFGEAITSMKGMREELFDIVGTPMFKSFAPILRNLQSEFKANRHEIEAWGESVGKQAAAGVKIAGEYIKDMFTKVRDNWDGIAAGIGIAATALKSTAEFLVERKDVFGRMAMMGTGGFVNMAQGTPGHTSAGGILGDVAGGAMVGGKMGGGVGALIGATVGAIGALDEELVALYEDVAISAGWHTKKRAALEAEIAAYDKSIAQHHKEIEAINKSVDQTMHYIKGRDALVDMLGIGSATKQPSVVPAVGFGELGKMPRADMVDFDVQTQALSDSMTQSFNEMFAAAQASHDAGAMTTVQNILSHNAQLQYALVTSGIAVGKGFDDLIDAMIAGGQMTAEAGKAAKDMVMNKGGKIDPSKMAVRVGGGNTINVKQEFREGDPDRILLAFKQMVTKAATSRISSKVSGVFGGF